VGKDSEISKEYHIDPVVSRCVAQDVVTVSLSCIVLGPLLFVLSTSELTQYITTQDIVTVALSRTVLGPLLFILSTSELTQYNTRLMMYIQCQLQSTYRKLSEPVSTGWLETGSNSTLKKTQLMWITIRHRRLVEVLVVPGRSEELVSLPHLKLLVCLESKHVTALGDK